MQAITQAGCEGFGFDFGDVGTLSVDFACSNHGCLRVLRFLLTPESGTIVVSTGAWTTHKKDCEISV